jgi:MFS family permease
MLFVFMLPNNPLIYGLAVVLNGIFMIGFNVSKFRHNMKLSKGVHMNTYLSVHGFFAGIAMFISTNVSGLVVDLVGERQIQIYQWQLNSYQLLLAVAGILNLLAVYYFVRVVEKEKPYGRKSKSTCPC